ncbi:MAG: hypothetical protein SNH79_03700 [Rikenellaceae bacterium]
MKNIITKAAALCAVALFGFVGASFAQDYTQMQTRILEPQQSCIVRPMTADLNLIKSQRVVFVAHYEILPGKFDVEIYTSMAIAAVSREFEADVFVAPLWEAETYKAGKSKMIKVTVTGYPARYSGFRPSNMQDAYFIK